MQGVVYFASLFGAIKVTHLQSVLVVYQTTNHMIERPEVLLSRADYAEDIKVRWAIHQYEVKKFQEDLSLLVNCLVDKAYYMSID